MVSFQTAIHDERPTWHNPRILVTLFLVFLCGAASGAIAMRFRSSPPVSAKSSSLFWKEGGKVITLNKFRKELNLTEQQSTEIEAALDEFVTYYQSLQLQMDDFRAYGKQRIMKTLNAEQRIKFEQMLMDLQARLR